MIDLEALRVRLLDILGRFGRRDAFEADPRVEGWVGRLAEAERPEVEVERLRVRVAELEAAFELERHVVADLEAEDRELEAALRERLQRDAHVVAVEAERDALRARVAYALKVARHIEEEGGLAVDHGSALLRALEGDTPSLHVVDSE